MKRIIAFLLVLSIALIPAGAFAAGKASVSVSCTGAAPGGTAEVVFSVTENPGIASCIFDITWDTSEFLYKRESSQAGPVFSGQFFSAKGVQPGRMTVTWYCPNNYSENGEMFRFALDVMEAAKPGVHTLNILVREFKDEHGNDVPLDISSAEVQVFGYGQAGAGDDPLSGQSGLSFTDINSAAYYYDAVRWAVGSKVTSGVTTTKFDPEGTCTRAQVVTFQWRAAGRPEPKTTSNPFKDVSPNAYYYKAVLWAVENGITKGTTATTFSPDATINRAQAITFMWRAAGSKTVDGQGFVDVPAGAYYEKAVNWGYANGVLTSSDGHFYPVAPCTRAQTVTFLYKCYGN
jgi:hypothetical protein